MITVENIKKSYGSIQAVSGISFTIHPGETFGLLGPNGAGKSTTIQMLSGLLKPDSGTIEINGISDPTRLEVRKNIGTTPQSIALYDDLTGWENLSFFGKLYGLSGKALKSRCEWALEFSGLSERRKDRVGIYSGGMKRRLNLACSLLHEPQVLLMDEPTAGVDPQSRNLIFENIQQIKQSGRIILYTTHYMEEAQRLCGRVAIMDHGKLLALDTVEGLVRTYGGNSILEAVFDQAPKHLNGIPGKLEGTQFRTETQTPLETLARINALGVNLISLHIKQANLEDVFLNLTGRRLRD